MPGWQQGGRGDELSAVAERAAPTVIAAGDDTADDTADDYAGDTGDTGDAEDDDDTADAEDDDTAGDAEDDGDAEDAEDAEDDQVTIWAARGRIRPVPGGLIGRARHGTVGAMPYSRSDAVRRAD